MKTRAEASSGVVMAKTPTHLTGMTGVYLAAAELSRRGFVVAPTSRGASGADLLVTDQGCLKAWSVEVKTNIDKKDTWSLRERARNFYSDSYIYIFVNVTGKDCPEYTVVASKKVADNMQCGPGKWWWFNRNRLIDQKGEGWKLFGNPVPKAQKRSTRKPAA
jgi:hypothetical protein